VPVDQATLATQSDGVYTIGGLTSIAIAGGKFLPKASVFANRQARVVAPRIATELRGAAPADGFDGAGACFLELGGGAAAYASGSFHGEAGRRCGCAAPAATGTPPRSPSSSTTCAAGWAEPGM
jgi:sulfide:quinone oxidoreductase